MPRKGGKKRKTPRKAYAQKAQRAVEQRNRNVDAFEGGLQSFSMIEVARNTEYHSSWGSKQLRHGHINFISASLPSTEMNCSNSTKGENSLTEGERALQKVPESSDTGHELEENLHNECDRDLEVPNISEFGTEADTVSAPLKHPSRDSRSNKLRFFVDLTGDESAPRLNTQKMSRTFTKYELENDGTETDSSEEIVLFTGRKAGSVVQRDLSSKDLNIQAVEENIRSFTLRDKTEKSRRNVRCSPDWKDNGHILLENPQMSALETDVLVESASDLAVKDYMDNISKERIADSDDSAEGDNDDDGLRREGHSSEERETSDDSGEYSSEVTVNSEDLPPDDSKLEKAKSAMTDEGIAQRLAKQEELGLGSSDIILWHEDDMASGLDEKAGLDFLRSATREFRKARKNRRKGTQVSPSASLNDMSGVLHDENDNHFDIKDFGRSSLRSRSKGMKYNFISHVSDSEFEANMLMTWEKDRKKKRQRKQDREMTRAETRLDGRENARLLLKYPDGIKIDEVKHEVMIFLDSDESVLPLIPMDKGARRAVHELANKLKLRSKSRGNGSERYPCLFKTSSTVSLDDPSTSSIFMRFGLSGSSRRFGLQSKGKFKKQEKNSGQSRRIGGGSLVAGVSYRDGETVGGTAPAIGSDNKGHALLSKMGWTSGTALGAVNNKGALEPVKQVVKITKAGLG